MIYFFIYLINFSISEPSSNYKILDSLCKSQSIEISKLLLKNSKTEFDLSIKSPYNPIILKSNLFRAFDSLNLINIQGGDSLNLELLNYGVKYSSTEESDKIKRTINVKSFIINKYFSNIYFDTILRTDILLIEDTNYSELKAVVPDPNKNFVDYILEPVVLIGSGIITLLLLFTIRS